MHKIINIYKPLAVTPYQLIQMFRSKYHEYEKVKIGFAGRLDPMAHGVMLLMIGDETKHREKYLGLSKEYEFGVIFGISTDSYDTLGILNSNNFKHIPGDLEKHVKTFINSKIGKQTQSYPPYSSKTVNGKPLYLYARQNKLLEVKIPKREIEIYNFELLNTYSLDIFKLKKIIIENINSINGDFRQKEIMEKWSELFKNSKSKTLRIAKFRINCSSGTYVRSLANEMGSQFGSGAVALSIFRTSVGKYTVDSSIKL